MGPGVVGAQPCSFALDLKGLAQLEDDLGALFIQSIRLFQRPGYTDAESGDAFPARLQVSDQLEAPADQYVV